MRAALVGLALLAAGAAQGQQVQLPGYAIPQAVLDEFSVCRAALLLHLDGPEDPAATVPRATARAMLDMSNFVIAETILGQPTGDVESGQTLVRFLEGWFLDFAQTIAAERVALSDRATREARLMGCMPLLWIAARPMIDQMAAWRLKAMDPPRFPNDAEFDVIYDDLSRKLGVAP